MAVFANVDILDAFTATGTASGVVTLSSAGAISASEITSDTWLYNVKQTSIGTFGLGIGSDLWWNQT